MTEAGTRATAPGTAKQEGLFHVHHCASGFSLRGVVPLQRRLHAAAKPCCVALRHSSKSRRATIILYGSDSGSVRLFCVEKRLGASDLTSLLVGSKPAHDFEPTSRAEKSAGKFERVAGEKMIQKFETNGERADNVLAETA